LLAQSIDDIKDLIIKQQWDKAKTAVDAFLADEKNVSKWEGWWYKGVIYNEIAKSEPYKNLVKDGRMEAFNAFKKYYELDTKAIQGNLEQHVRLYDIIINYIRIATTQFNIRKQYDSAYNNFKNAYTVEEYFTAKGFEYLNYKFPVFDTLLIRNIALSAYKAKREDESISYYKKITDKKIADTAYIDAYYTLVEYYNKKKDLTNREKYLQLGRELFPNDDFWYQVELADVDGKDKKILFSKYEELIKKYPNQFYLFYSYAVELFNYEYINEVRPPDYKEKQKKIDTILNKALSFNKETTEVFFIEAKHLYNVVYDLQVEARNIKGTTADDQKKRNDLKNLSTVKNDELIKYGEIVFEDYKSRKELEPREKENFKSITEILVSAFEIKGDKAKIDFYKKKLDTL
jgi:hypothetical protein